MFPQGEGSKSTRTYHDLAVMTERRCPICGEIRQDNHITNSLRHVQRHLPPTVNCSRAGCPYQTTNHMNLYQHERAHQGYQREHHFKCPSCPKTFDRPSILNDHVQIHLRQKVECPDCGKQVLPRYLTHHQKALCDARVGADEITLHKCPRCDCTFDSYGGKGSSLQDCASHP